MVPVGASISHPLYFTRYSKSQQEGTSFGQECENRKEEVYWKSALADYTRSSPIEAVH